MENETDLVISSPISKVNTNSNTNTNSKSNSNIITNFSSYSDLSMPTNSGISDINNTNTSDNSSFQKTTVFSFISNMSWSVWVIIIFVLIFLGFNIFVYLAKGSELVNKYTEPIIKVLFGNTIATTGQIVDVSSEGTKGVLKATNTIVKSGINETQKFGKKMKQQELNNSDLNNDDDDTDENTENNNYNNKDNNTLNNALNIAKAKETNNNDYQANESETKSGWCFIGLDKNVRTCMKISDSDKCMSGNIFPSQEICINPRLRE